MQFIVYNKHIVGDSLFSVMAVFLYSFPYNYFLLNMNMSFSSLWGPCSSQKASEAVKGRHFLIHEKSPLTSTEGDVIIIFGRRGFKKSLQKMLLCHLLDIQKSHCFFKTSEGDLIVLSKRRIKTCLGWDLNLGLLSDR